MDNDHNERMALFRYSVISEALDAGLSAAERGLIVHALAHRTWTTPVGEEREASPGEPSTGGSPRIGTTGSGPLPPIPGPIEVRSGWSANGWPRQCACAVRFPPARPPRSPRSSDEPTGSG